MFAQFRRPAAISLILIGSVLFSVIGAALGHVLAGGNIAPRNMLVQYYGYINARQYAPAYQQWINPPQSYDNFVAGYANTASVQARFGGFQPAAAGSLDGAVPGILVGVDLNGSPSAYYGCYFLRYNDTVSGLAQWMITGANFTQVQVAVGTAPSQFLIDTDCYHLNVGSNGGVGQVVPDTTVEQMLANYYNTINLLEYPNAYGFWASAQQTYQDFANGWSTTSETVFFFGTYQPYTGPYATNETGRIPVVLLGYHTDGSLVAYQGCLGVNFSAIRPGGWALWASYVQPMPFTMTPGRMAMAQALGAACY